MALVEPLAGKAPVAPLSWDREKLDNQIEEAISCLGGVVHGGSMREIHDKLVSTGIVPDGTPLRRTRSSLWHRTECGAIEYSGRKPEGLGSVSENEARHCYRLVCS